MFDSITSPLDLDGVGIGPVDVAVTRDRIAFYVDVTGDDPARWVDTAPPGFASSLLFAVADLFLYDPAVVPFTATLLHVDQAFSYHAPMRAGTTITMFGSIVRVRERAGSYFVTFEATGTDADGVVVESASTFVLSAEPAPRPDVEHVEPPVRVKAEDHGTVRSASRHDLVRYAAATRDFNPLHWDHETAVTAGVPGTIVQGLLMYAWLTQVASQAVGGTDVTSAKVRFRSALHPGEQAAVTATPGEDAIRLELVRDDVQLVTGIATVALEG